MAALKIASGTGTGNWVVIPNGATVKVTSGTGTGSWATVNKIYVATDTGTGDWEEIWANA